MFVKIVALSIIRLILGMVEAFVLINVIGNL